MATDRLGLYVHIPYCVRKCNYCDFCSLPVARRGVPDEYVARLVEEILSYKSEVKQELSTLYFGGGTPSLLLPAQLERIMAAVRRTFVFLEGAELTFEANPGTVTHEIAFAFAAEGFNRVSLGLQSIHENEMKKLGRIHNFAEFKETYFILREAGFDNINVDLMYGIPHQTLDSFAETLSALTELAPEHISCYGLMVEEGTPFFREADRLPLPGLECECDMYELACDRLRSLGYSHYEISNYAKQGRESRHNLLYWNMKEYIGVGASAHSYYRGKRYFNTDIVEEYLAGTGSAFDTAEDDPLDSERYEYAMLALRLSEGLSLSDYRARYGVSFLDGKESIVDRLCRSGLMTLCADRLSLTERGFYVSNSILIEIL